MKVSKTYDVIIPNSKEALDGDYSESGFEYEDAELDIDAMLIELNYDFGFAELQVINDVEIRISTIDPSIDYFTGHETFYTLHINGTKNEIDELCNRYSKYLK